MLLPVLIPFLDLDECFVCQMNCEYKSLIIRLKKNMVIPQDWQHFTENFISGNELKTRLSKIHSFEIKCKILLLCVPRFIKKIYLILRSSAKKSIERWPWRRERKLLGVGWSSISFMGMSNKSLAHSTRWNFLLISCYRRKLFFPPQGNCIFFYYLFAATGVMIAGATSSTPRPER